MNINPNFTSKINLPKEATDVLKTALEAQLKNVSKKPVSLQELKKAADAGDVFQKIGNIIK